MVEEYLLESVRRRSSGRNGQRPDAGARPPKWPHDDTVFEHGEARTALER